MREGYYGFDLQQALCNKVVAKTGRDRIEVDQEIFTLIEETEGILYEIHNRQMADINNDENIQIKYREIFSKLNQLSLSLTGKELKESTAVQIINDYFTGSHNAKVYFDPEEKVTELTDYDIYTGSATWKLSKRKNFRAEGFLQDMPVNRMIRTGNESNDDYSKVKDNEIDYMSR